MVIIKQKPRRMARLTGISALLIHIVFLIVVASISLERRTFVENFPNFSSSIANFVRR